VHYLFKRTRKVLFGFQLQSEATNDDNLVSTAYVRRETQPTCDISQRCDWTRRMRWSALNGE